MSTGLHGGRARQGDIVAVRHGQGARSKAQGLENDHVVVVVEPSPPPQRHIRTPVQHIDIELSVQRQTDRRQGDAHRFRTAEGARLQERRFRVSLALGLIF